MEPSSTQQPKASDSNGRIRVAVWIPYSSLARELQALLNRSRDFVVVDLNDHHRVPQAVRANSADVFVIDVDAAPRGSSTQVVADTHRFNPDLRLLVLSALSDPRLVKGILGAGATGYLLKDRAFEELADAIRAVARGERFVSQMAENVSRVRGDIGACEATNQVTADGRATRPAP